MRQVVEVPFSTGFMEKVAKGERAGDHWYWTGRRTADGDPVATVYHRRAKANRTYRVRRLIYWMTTGELPEGMVVVPTCGVKECLNPSHLEAKTRSEHWREVQGGRDRGDAAAALRPRGVREEEGLLGGRDE